MAALSVARPWGQAPRGCLRHGRLQARVSRCSPQRSHWGPQLGCSIRAKEALADHELSCPLAVPSFIVAASMILMCMMPNASLAISGDEGGQQVVISSPLEMLGSQPDTKVSDRPLQHHVLQHSIHSSSHINS